MAHTSSPSPHVTILHFHHFPPGSALVFTTRGCGGLCAAVQTSIQEELPRAVEEGLNDLTAANYLLYSCDNEERDVSKGQRGCYEVTGHGPLVFSGLVGVTSLLDAIRSNPSLCLSHPLCSNIREGDWLFRYLVDRLDSSNYSFAPLSSWMNKIWGLLSTSFYPTNINAVIGVGSSSPHTSTTASTPSSPSADIVSVSKSSDYCEPPSSLSSPTTTIISDKCEPLVLETEDRILPSTTSSSTSSSSAVSGCSGASGDIVEDAEIAGLASWLKPFYFDLIICSLMSSIKRRVISLMGGFIANSSDSFVHRLAMASLQFYGFTPSGSVEFGSEKPSLCAGLPHFSTGFMRNWGRDTFIAMKGILLVTGRYCEAREEILAYAKVVRNGLVPNLLDGGNTPRYNARDATWFFLQAIQDYCSFAPEGTRFLSTAVELKYPVSDEDPPVANIADLIHHILYKHARGISFTEWNAGKGIDEHMTTEGFDVKISLDPSTGLLFGGNDKNCGTWMDKMGSSSKAFNKGIPATSRDGAAIEIIGLLKSTLSFLNTIPEEIFSYKSVELADGEGLTYNRWNSLLSARFEKVFYVPAVGKEEKECDNFIDVNYVHKRQIYKDLYKATHPWCDYQLRPNMCIAMAVAPEMFVEDHAVNSLHVLEDCLYGEDQIGLKTLDANDFNYRGYYDNVNNGDDKHVAHGWNYHQGPEWVWPVGYFLQAKFEFLRKSEGSTTAKQMCMHNLRNQRRHLITSPWKSLPELTNQGGRDCFFSCPAQAWSVGTILAFMHSLTADITSSTSSTTKKTSARQS